MSNIVFKDVPETWEELKDFCFENYPDLKVDDETITDWGLCIEKDGYIEFYDNCLIADSDIKSIYLFLRAIYG